MRDRAVGQHHVDREHVGGRDARREAVRPAGVGRDVAADRARLLRRRIGRVVQAQVRDRRLRSRLSTPGSTQAMRSVGVDLEDPVELRGHDHDRIVDGRGAAGQSGAAAPRRTDGRAAPRPAPLPRRLHPIAGSTPDRGPPLDARVAAVQRELERFGARGRDRGRRGRSARSACVVVDVPSLRRPSLRSMPDRDVARDGHVAASDGAWQAEARVGDVRRSRGRGAHVADRRHLPPLVVELHLRLRLPGRLDRADARAGARLLLVRRALHRDEGPRPRRRSGQALERDEWQFAKRRAKKGIFGRPARRRRHGPSGAPASSTTPASSSTAPASRPARAARCTSTRCTPASTTATSSPRCAGRCRCDASTTSEDDGTVISTLTEFGRDGWGEGGDDFAWWCTEDRRRSSARGRSTSRSRWSSARCSATSSTARSPSTSTPAGRHPSRPWRTRPRCRCHRQEAQALETERAFRSWPESNGSGALAIRATGMVAGTTVRSPGGRREKSHQPLSTGLAGTSVAWSAAPREPPASCAACRRFPNTSRRLSCSARRSRSTRSTSCLRTSFVCCACTSWTCSSRLLDCAACAVASTSALSLASSRSAIFVPRRACPSCWRSSSAFASARVHRSASRARSACASDSVFASESTSVASSASSLARFRSIPRRSTFVSIFLL